MKIGRSAASIQALARTSAFVTVFCGLIGCAPMSSELAAETPAVVDGVSQENGFRLTERSNVCVQMTVDQEVWPVPLDDDSVRNFSNGLQVVFYQASLSRDVSSFLADGREHRFVSDFDRAHPDCRDQESDIYLTVQYSPRDDGTPFVFQYRMEQNGVPARFGEYERDAEGDLQAGRLNWIYFESRLQSALGQDLEERVEWLLDQLE